MLALVIWLVCATPPPEMTAPVRDYADVTLQVSGEQLSVLNVQRGRFNKPTALRRFRGRFLVRVIGIIDQGGAKLLEETRFDFPLLADAETDDVSDEERVIAERLRRGVSAKTTVRVPLPEGAASLLVVDTKTKREVGYSLKKATAPSPAPAAVKAGAPPAR